MLIDAYRAELAAFLDGKDPRASGAGEGSALLVFPEEGTITVQLHRSKVKVLEGGHSLIGKPTVLVRTTLQDWLRYCEAPEAKNAGALEIFGDEAVLDDLAKLVGTKRSPLATRFNR